MVLIDTGAPVERLPLGHHAVLRLRRAEQAAAGCLEHREGRAGTRASRLRCRQPLRVSTSPPAASSTGRLRTRLRHAGLPHRTGMASASTCTSGPSGEGRPDGAPARHDILQRTHDLLYGEFGVRLEDHMLITETGADGSPNRPFGGRPLRTGR